MRFIVLKARKVVMDKKEAIERAGGATALAKMLGINPAAVSQWGEKVPDARVWQLRVLKPEWFKKQCRPVR